MFSSSTQSWGNMRTIRALLDALPLIALQIQTPWGAWNSLRPPKMFSIFVTVLYSDLGEAVERLRVKLDVEAQQQAKEEGSNGKEGSASSNGDSGIENASPPEEIADRDFPSAIQSPPGTTLPSCPWDYPLAEDLTPIKSLQEWQKTESREQCQHTFPF
ncbi:hypothetical protein KUCAC02_000386 [Chaenocephalus aceratus]|uniref:Uncharacterized protein n=1 Tax=Chaenocephalus aceratus TaxID=36190 RepID=A0ACB9W6X7_CHAAC|nr:hypothetical protein KUCAC02_000386 [Chaenocephalus aceratus]